MATIRPESLQKCLQDIVDEYEVEVKTTIDEIFPEVGKETVKELKKTSPKDRGKYSKTWKSKIEQDRLGKKLVIYNKDNYRLTHLLEKGHALSGGGRAEAVVHIKPAQDKAVKKIVEEIKRRLDK